jgi:hypothetical protein
LALRIKHHILAVFGELFAICRSDSRLAENGFQRGNHDVANQEDYNQAEENHRAGISIRISHKVCRLGDKGTQGEPSREHTYYRGVYASDRVNVGGAL